jgi:pectate lyase
MSDIRVSNAAELQKAVAGAKGGDRILLAGGNYGSVSLLNKKLATDVTITSADVNNQARIEILTVKNSSHLIFKSLEIGRPLKAGEANFAQFGIFAGVSNITIDGVFVHGSLDGDAGNDGNGLGFRDSDHITVKNSRFEQVGRGLQVGTTTDVLVQNNVFTNIRMDGMDFADVQRVVIDGNKLSNFFAAPGDHPDAIQFWTSGTTRASSDIVIRNNEIFQGEGRGIQGIFLKDELGNLPFANVTIQNNLVYVQDGYNGIAVDHGNNISVIGNTVLGDPKDNEKERIFLQNVTGGTVKNNLAEALVDTKNNGISFSNNVFLENSPAYLSRVKGVNALSKATVSGLRVDGIGYQPVASGSPAPKPAPQIGPSTGVQASEAQIGTAFNAQVFAPSGLASVSTKPSTVTALPPVFGLATSLKVTAFAPMIGSMLGKSLVTSDMLLG